MARINKYKSNSTFLNPKSIFKRPLPANSRSLAMGECNSRARNMFWRGYTLQSSLGTLSLT